MDSDIKYDSRNIICLEIEEFNVYLLANELN